MIEDRRDYSLAASSHINECINKFTTFCGEPKRLCKDFLTLNGHGISDARCSLLISIFFHTHFFFSFAIHPSLSFFSFCLPGHRLSDIVKYVVICCVFVCFFSDTKYKMVWCEVAIARIFWFDTKDKMVEFLHSWCDDTDSYFTQYAFEANETESKGKKNK